MMFEKENEEVDDQLYLLEVIVDHLFVHKESILSASESAEDREETRESAEPLVKKEQPKKGPIKVKVKFFDCPTIEIGESDFKTPVEPTTSPVGSDSPANADFPEVRRLKMVKVEEEKWRSKLAGLSYATWKRDKEENLQTPSLAQGIISPGNRFQSGKSCLFPLSPKAMIEVIRSQPIEIQVHREATFEEPAHLIGSEKIYMGENFIDAVTLASTPIVLPISSVIEDVFDLKNVFGDVSATIGLMIRLSCFGTTIFTQFKYNEKEKEYLFMTSEGGPKISTIEKRPPSHEEDKVEEDSRFEPCFADVDAITFPECEDSPRCDSVFKLPVPWRKLSDKLPNIQICSPRDLFMDGNRGTDDNVRNIDLNLIFPGSVTPGLNQTQLYPNHGGGLPIRDVIPGTGGYKGTPFGPLETPPGTKFPNQYGTNWILNQSNPPSFPPGPQYICRNNEEPRYYPPTEEAPQFPKAGARPDTYNCVQCDCTTSSPENTTVTTLTSDRVTSLPPSPPTISQQQPNVIWCPNQKPEYYAQQQQYMQQYGQPQYNQPQQQYSQQQYGQQPIYGQQNIPMGPPLSGLEALSHPDQRNMNVLRQPFFSPVCPPDSTFGTTSLCTCPKVPAALSEPRPGYIKCECTNILTTLKPIDLPYSTCPPKPTDYQVRQSQMQPVPIYIPARPAECPLAKLLREAEEIKNPRHHPTFKEPGGKDLGAKTEPLESINENEMDSAPDTEAKRKETEAETGTKKVKPVKRDTSELIVTDSHSSGQQGSGKEGKRKRPPDSAKKMLKEELEYYDEVMGELEMVSDTDNDSVPKPSFSKTASKKEPAEISATAVRPRSSSIPAFVDNHEAELAYTYTAGMYPGVIIGHKNCVPVYQMVPKNMGWLWNIADNDGYLKPSKGWRPGAIQNNVIKVIEGIKKRKDKIRGLYAVSKSRNPKNSPKKGKSSGLQKSMNAEESGQLSGAGDGPAIDNGPIDVQPTLHLHKKNGRYYVTMFPTKKTKVVKANKKGEIIVETSEDERPVQFLIDPKNPDGLEGGGDEEYDSPDTSTISDDSYEFEFMSPSSLQQRIRPTKKIDNQIQVIEDELEPERKLRISYVNAINKSPPPRKPAKKGKKGGKGKKGKKKGKK